MSIRLWLAVLLTLTLCGVSGAADGGGGDSDEGTIRLDVDTTKPFSGDPVKLTASVSRPWTKENSDSPRVYTPGNVTDVTVHFSHGGSDNCDSGGDADVTWTATHPGGDGTMYLTATVAEEDGRTSYEEDDAMPNNDTGDRRGRDHKKIKVMPGSVALTVHEINEDGSTGEEVEGVPVDRTIRVVARVRNTTATTLGFLVQSQPLNTGWPDPDSADWETLPIESGRAEHDMVLADPHYYRFHVDLDGEKDQAECVGAELSVDLADDTRPVRLGARICSNAQDIYRSSQWVATVLPKGTKARLSDTGGPVSIAQSTVEDQQLIVVRADENTFGYYSFEYEHEDTSEVVDLVVPGEVFRFAFVSSMTEFPTTDPQPDDNQGRFGTKVMGSIHDNREGGTYERSHVDDGYARYPGAGDTELDYTGGGTLHNSAGGQQSIVTPWPVMLNTEAWQGMGSGKLAVVVEPAIAYEGRARTRAAVSYSASTDYIGTGTGSWSVGLRFSFGIVSVAPAAYTGSGVTKTQTAIAAQVDDHFMRGNNAGATIGGILGGTENGNYTTSVSFTTEFIELDFSSGPVAGIPLKVEAAVQASSEKKPFYIINLTSIDPVVVSDALVEIVP